MKKSAIIILAVFIPLFAAAQYGRQPVSPVQADLQSAGLEYQHL